ARPGPQQGCRQGLPHRPSRRLQRPDADGHALRRRDGARAGQGAAQDRRCAGCSRLPQGHRARRAARLGVRLYVTPASPWVRRVRVTILELGIEDRFEFVQTKWPHSWGTQTVAMPADFTAATAVMRIPALVADGVTLTDSHSICDYLNAE